MIIGVNARPLIKPFTGMEQHLKYLFRDLANIAKNDHFIMYVPEKINADLRVFFPKNVEIRYLAEKQKGNKGMQKTWWEQIQIPNAMQKDKADIAYFSYPANPWYSDFYKKFKTVLTIHDAIPWKFKEYRTGVLSKMYHSQTLKAVKRADLVLTVSKTSKKDIVKISKVSEDKVKVVYNDVADAYKKKIEPGYLNLQLKRYNLKRHNYFIYCGGFDERKNVRVLIKEYFRFVESFEGKDVPELVLVGDKLFDNELYSSFDSYSHGKNGYKGGRLIQTGFLDEDELAALYSSARAFIHLSREEGFNIPLLEAANQSCPLILSDIDVHREIAKSNAIFADIEGKSNCHDKMLQIMKDAEYKHYKEISKNIAREFLWERSALRANDLLKNL